MKSCPACKTQYSDDTLLFCLQDGTPLLPSTQADTPTVVLGETETFVREGRINVPVNDTSSAAWQQSQVTHVASAMPEKKRSNTTLILILAALGLIVILSFIGLAGFVFYRNSQQMVAGNAANVPGFNTNYNAFPTPQGTPGSMPSTPPPTPVLSPATTPPNPAIASPPVLKSYPSTTRLKLARGSYSTSFGGDLNPGDDRSVVLACRSGQSLSATVSSGGGCVTLRGGGTSVRVTTNRGDNYVTVTNKCSSVVHFSISVTII